jgi:hypothetical protein
MVCPWTSWCRTTMCSVAATQVTASNEDEGFARAIEDFIVSAGAAVPLVCGTSSTVGVADPQAVPQPK